jgi:hypothetical protein
MAAPKVGHVEDGMIYKGGDHKDPNNWVPIQGQKKSPSFGGRVARGLMDVEDGMKLGLLQALEAGQGALGIEPSGIAGRFRDSAERRMAEYEGTPNKVDLGRTVGRSLP